MRGLLLAAACVYASRSFAPGVIRRYFDVLLIETIVGYGVLLFVLDTSALYRYIYIGLVTAVLLSSFAVAALWTPSGSIYLLCCAAGVTLAITEWHKPMNVNDWIQAIEGGGFLAVGLVMAITVPRAYTASDKLVAAVFAANWLCKAMLDFTLLLTGFGPKALEAAQVLPWAWFLASAVTVGYAFRHQPALGIAGE
jgi:hypothetical protein